MNKSNIIIKRALISVYDKTGIVDFAKYLSKIGVEILSTGGTAHHLRKSGINIIDVSEYTGFPEIMDGRIKTINPKIEGGILGLRDQHHNDAKQHNIKWIDMVVCNMYPFADTINNPNAQLEDALKNIDIGGPTMIRSAAKNIDWVTAVVNAEDYSAVTDELKEKGTISYRLRKNLSSKAFGYCAGYDSTVHNYLNDDVLPQYFTPALRKHYDVRYGENPHQEAAAYKNIVQNDQNILDATIHQGKLLSYNNLMDADAALACIREFKKPTCVVAKHGNPCGVASGEVISDAYQRAFNADSKSAFGGIIALNRRCDLATAEKIGKVFVEIVIAPEYSNDALNILSKKKNLRVLEVGNIQRKKPNVEHRYINGGLLVQQSNVSNLNNTDLIMVTKKHPNGQEITDMLFAWKVLKHVKSNAIITVKNNTTLGVGAGQVSRVDAVEIALKKSRDQLNGAVLASDAFFPFRDSIDFIADTDVKTIIQPGGSIRDNEVIDACNEYDISMVFTGRRCFKH